MKDNTDLFDKILCDSKYIDNHMIDEIDKGQITINIYKDVLSKDPGEVFNFIEFIRFSLHVKSKKAFKIRIIYLNFEGDIIIKNLIYDGEEITLIIDSSRVKFYGGDDITVYKGDYIKREEKEGRLIFSLVKEEQNWSITILSFFTCLPYKSEYNGLWSRVENK